MDSSHRNLKLPCAYRDDGLKCVDNIRVSLLLYKEYDLNFAKVLSNKFLSTHHFNAIFYYSFQSVLNDYSPLTIRLHLNERVGLLSVKGSLDAIRVTYHDFQGVSSNLLSDLGGATTV